MSVSESAVGTIDRRRLLAGGAAIVIVIATIAWLVRPSPSGPLVLKSGTPHHLVTVAIDNLRIGSTDIDITVTNRAGAAKDHAAVWIQANQPLMGYAGQPVVTVAAGSGHFHAVAVLLMMTGPWELHLSIDEHDGVDELVVPLWVGG